MIGIYKITNKLNGKIYIGKSIDIEKRWKEHIRHSKDEFTKKKPIIHKAINKYGPDSFIFEVLEECQEDKLNELEMYYINKYNSNNKNIGYNITNGGDGGPIMYGEENPNSVLNNDIVEYIRQSYANGLYKMDVYNELKEKYNLNFNTFNSIWFGKSYKNIMPEVFSKENRIKQRNISYTLGMRLRHHPQKVKKYVYDIRLERLNGKYWKDVYSNYLFMNEHTFKDIWYNRTFKNIIPKMSVTTIGDECNQVH